VVAFAVVGLRRLHGRANLEAWPVDGLEVDRE
jgi:hypothetical protein